MGQTKDDLCQRQQVLPNKKKSLNTETTLPEPTQKPETKNHQQPLTTGYARQHYSEALIARVGRQSLGLVDLE